MRLLAWFCLPLVTPFFLGGLPNLACTCGQPSCGSQAPQPPSSCNMFCPRSNCPSQYQGVSYQPPPAAPSYAFQQLQPSYPAPAEYAQVAQQQAWRPHFPAYQSQALPQQENHRPMYASVPEQQSFPAPVPPVVEQRRPQTFEYSIPSRAPPAPAPLPPPLPPASYTIGRSSEPIQPMMTSIHMQQHVSSHPTLIETQQEYSESENNSNAATTAPSSYEDIVDEQQPVENVNSGQPSSANESGATATTHSTYEKSMQALQKVEEDSYEYSYESSKEIEKSGYNKHRDEELSGNSVSVGVSSGISQNREASGGLKVKAEGKTPAAKGKDESEIYDDLLADMQQLETDQKDWKRNATQTSTEQTQSATEKRSHTETQQVDEFFKAHDPKQPMKCNSEKLRRIMQQKMSFSPSVSKQMIYSAVLDEFNHPLNVICSRSSFSYIVVTSPTYCEHKKHPTTCFAFFQP